MSVYTADKTFRLQPIPQAVVAFVLLIVSLKTPWALALLPIPVLLALPSLLRFHLIQISIDDNLLGTTLANRLGQIRMQQYPLAEIDFIYRDRPIHLNFGAHSLEDRRGNVLSIFHKEHMIIDLEPGQQGWTNGDISLMASELKHSGVKQVMEKFGDKDVQIS